MYKILYNVQTSVTMYYNHIFKELVNIILRRSVKNMLSLLTQRERSIILCSSRDGFTWGYWGRGFCVKSLAIIKQNNKVLGLYDLIDNFVFKRNDMLGSLSLSGVQVMMHPASVVGQALFYDQPWFSYPRTTSSYICMRENRLFQLLIPLAIVTYTPYFAIRGWINRVFFIIKLC